MAGTLSVAFMAMLRRDAVVTARSPASFLVPVLLEPLFFLLVFGALMPQVGLTIQGFGALLLPGVLALTVATAAYQGVTLPLVLDLGIAREIDDRLLAPVPVVAVGLEKIVFAALRGLVAGAVMLAAAPLVLRGAFQVRGDELALMATILVLTALAGGGVGLLAGTIIRPEQLGLTFTLIFVPMIFTGCTYYPWSALHTLPWLQALTLCNPLTYASEGLRAAMVPPLQGHPVATLGAGWSLAGLALALGVSVVAGLASFQRRVTE